MSRPDDLNGTKGTVSFCRWWRQIRVMIEAEPETLRRQKKGSIHHFVYEDG